MALPRSAFNHKFPAKPKYWAGKIGPTDDFGGEITDTFYDAKTMRGPWAIMNPASFARHRITRDGSLGMGLGQKYEKQEDGRWLKTGG